MTMAAEGGSQAAGIRESERITVLFRPISLISPIRPIFCPPELWMNLGFAQTILTSANVLFARTRRSRNHRTDWDIPPTGQRIPARLH